MGSILDFVSRLRSFANSIIFFKSNRVMLQDIGESIRREAQSAMGTYRYGWPRLKDETIARKRTGDSPLVETGRMRDSITIRVHTFRNYVEVYSIDRKFPWHEHGTQHIPPRPVFANAAKAQGYDAAGKVHLGLGVLVRKHF